MRSIYWFRRDLRTHDNRGLLEALEKSDEILAIYVFDKNLIDDLRSNIFHISFLFNAVSSLSKKIKLNLFYGDVVEVFDQILASYKPDAIYTSMPLSWSEKSLASCVSKICMRYGVKYIEILDNVLSDPRHNHPLSNFTAFYRSWLGDLDLKISPEVTNKRFIGNDGLEIDEIATKIGKSSIRLEQVNVEWGRRRLNDFRFESYDGLRNYPYVDGVSRLSHFINLGVISLRELYNKAVNSSKEYIRQLAWREYYIALSFRYPWMQYKELKPYMRGMEWENNKYYIERFINGETGYPIIDAGVKQLRTEGWIHNRVRLIMANFLVKNLHVDWRIGANLFKKTLLDYDEVLNTGNWQWAASAGIDPIPLRLFNPIKQAEKYDPMCLYIKKYLPEYEDIECRVLHDPLTYRIKGYYEPIVDYYESAKEYAALVKKKISEWKSMGEKKLK
ncbi:MAG: deoxyribodipyrimidine photo-lyase [Archaeoglobaceae archaeon]